MFGKKISDNSPVRKTPVVSSVEKKSAQKVNMDDNSKPDTTCKDRGKVEPVRKKNAPPKISEEDREVLSALAESGAVGKSKILSSDTASKQLKAHRGNQGSKSGKAEKKPDMFDDKFSEQQRKEDAAPKNNATSLRLERARNRIWLDLRDGIDLQALARMDLVAARDEIASAIQEISRFRNLDITPAELDQVAKECADDMLGYGPLEVLLDQDGIADIMINGPDTVYIEKNGKIEKAGISFRDNNHLTTICQRIVGAIGRRVDESSPICDARLPDGSRVNVIIPPLAVDGSCMTIRKFTKDKLTLDKLVEFGSVTPSCAKLIMAIGRCRVNILVSGGTGSGKTTMLNCLTRYIEQDERIVTCEDACELQLQQPHVVRLETRPPNLEGVGEVTMRDLVRNCLRMRPERIIVGEVRGPEAFDLLQAMNTGHDGSMGTVHANNPREALSRMENMIAMGGLNLPSVAVREQIASAVNVIIQIQRLRDGSRTVTHISEITGMEGPVVTMQDLFVLDIDGEDDNGMLIKKLHSTGLRPKFFDKARQYGVEQLIMDAMEEAFD